MVDYSYIYLSDKVYISLLNVNLYEKKYELLVNKDDDKEFVIAYEDNNHIIIETDSDKLYNIIARMLSKLFMLLE